MRFLPARYEALGKNKNLFNYCLFCIRLPSQYPMGSKDLVEYFKNAFDSLICLFYSYLSWMRKQEKSDEN